MKLDSQKLYSCIDWIIPAVFIVSIIECFFGIWRLATIVKFIAIGATLIMFIKGYIRKSKPSFTIFFLLSLMSSLAYFYNGRPLVCLSSDIMNTLPAMLFFLVGYNDKRKNRSFYDLMMYIGSAVLFLGIICYVLTPGWYTNSLVEARNNSQFSSFEYNDDLLLESLRFSSFFEDSYPVSLMSVYILSISLFNYFRRDEKIKYSLICVFISFVSAILCMHRVSIASAILILLGFIGFESIKGKGKQFFLIILGALCVTFVSSLVSETINERLIALQDMLTNRTEDMSFSSAYNERQGLSNKLMSQWRFPIFGHGLGSGGPTSRFLGYGGVTDAAYTKLLFENGIVGMTFFAILMITSVLRGFKYFKYYFVELSISCFIALAMSGSNTLSLAYLYILPFWYMLGRIWNKDYLEYAEKNNINI